ncbi:MAG: sugar phosphate isomerase/epimerase [Candidatus Omnitrophota bacterium]
MSAVLSTSWNAFRHTDGLSLIRDIKELGFDEVELGFNLTSSMIDSIEALVRDRYIRVASLHNFCPIPENVPREAALPDYYAISSKDEQQRKLAVAQTKITIDTAVRLNVEAVVLHCGRVEIPDRTIDLIALFNKGQRDSRMFSILRGDIMRQRDDVKKPYIENTLRSLEELNAYAASRRIKLGVETRYYSREIPFYDEIAVILDAFKDSQIYYWHDTGHAQLMENLGMVPAHEDFLKRYGSRMLGIHLHDITGCVDHQPPGTGEFDFTRVKPYISDATLKVVEVHHPATGSQLIKSREFLQNLFNG